MDKSNLRKVILDYPNQLHLGQKFAENISLPDNNYSNLIVCGMGGSAIPGDLLVTYLENNKKPEFPIYINHDYSLPENATQNSLIFISSYSGNTEETISCLEEAIKNKFSVISFCSGGKIEKISRENNIPVVKYSIAFENFQPRYAATYAFAAMYQVLTNMKLCDRIEKFPTINSLEIENLGKNLAKKIKGQVPVIYASNKLKILAKNWKIKINENTKSPAFWNYFPELNHNEMAGFSNPSDKFCIIFLKNKTDQAKIKKRMEITQKLYSEKGNSCFEAEIIGESYLEKMLYGLNLGDWTSYYLALEYGQDPTPIDIVEDFKAMMEK